MEETALSQSSFDAVWSRVSGSSGSFDIEYALRELISGMQRRVRSCLGWKRRRDALYPGLAAFERREKCMLSQLQTEYFIICGDTFAGCADTSAAPSLTLFLRECFIEETKAAGTLLDTASRCDDSRLSGVLRQLSAQSREQAAAVLGLLRKAFS